MACRRRRRKKNADAHRYSFDSPVDVQDSWQQALEEMRAEGDRIIAALPEHFTLEEALAAAFNKTAVELKFNSSLEDVSGK